MVDPDGRVLTALTRNGVFTVERLTAAGDSGPSFSGDGSQEIPLRGTSGADDVMAMADGGIVAAGVEQRRPGNLAECNIASPAHRGRPRPSFSGDGRRIVDLRCELEEGAMTSRPPLTALSHLHNCDFTNSVGGAIFASSSWVARFLTTPGVADADAVPDSTDRCPGAYGAGYNDGCARPRRLVAVKGKNKRLVGSIRSADADCKFDRKVFVRTDGDGKSAKVVSGRTAGDRFKISVGSDPGPFKVTIPPPGRARWFVRRGDQPCLGR